MKTFVTLLALVVLGCSMVAGCNVDIMTYQAPVVVDDNPLDEGMTYDGVVVVEPPGVTEYVFVDNHWSYWHPGHRRWVRAARYGNDWRHSPNGRRGHNGWGEYNQAHERDGQGHPNSGRNAPRVGTSQGRDSGNVHSSKASPSKQKVKPKVKPKANNKKKDKKDN